MRIIWWFSKSLTIVFLFCWSLNSSAQICNERILPTTPNSRFELSGDEVQDLKTGLIWQRCSVGQNWDGVTCNGLATIHTWSEALIMADGRWRLPNIKELYSIVEDACISPAINVDIFPNTVFGNALDVRVAYWSSTPVPFQIAWRYLLDFGPGGSGLDVQDNAPMYVRLVRSGQ